MEWWRTLVSSLDAVTAWWPWGTLVAAATAAITLIALGKDLVSAPKWFERLKDTFANNRAMPMILEAYQHELLRTTLELHHAWMPPGKSIAHVLVPAHAETATGKLVNVADYFLTVLLEKRPRKFVVAGPPGAGKSVAIGVMLRSAWLAYAGSESGGTSRMAALAPIPLKLADLKRAPTLQLQQEEGTSREFEIAEHIEFCMLQSLERLFFAHGRPRAAHVRQQFVNELVENQRLLLVVDGLDEVPRAERHQILEDVLTFVGRRHFCVFGCRDEVLIDHVAMLERHSVERLVLRGFTVPAAQRFLQRWAATTGVNVVPSLLPLAGPGSFRRIGQNPLLLTIACFLKSTDRRQL